MKGLKIIPIFTVLLTCTYLGTVFVERNRDPVSIIFGNSVQTPPAALGLVVLTSVLLGMILAGALCSIELMVLVMENRRLKKGLLPPRSEASLTKVPVEKRKEERPPEEEAEEPTHVSEPQKGGGSGSSNPNRFTPL